MFTDEKKKEEAMIDKKSIKIKKKTKSCVNLLKP